jgi:ornithine decarboxylase
VSSGPYSVDFFNLFFYRLVLRIRYNSPKALHQLGLKFGCDPVNEAPELLRLAKELNLNVIGIAFHVGSSNMDYTVCCQAIEICRSLFEIAEKIGFNLTILDIGGGFFGDTWDRVKEFSGLINKSLDLHFPIDEFPDLKIFAEPGR